MVNGRQYHYHYLGGSLCENLVNRYTGTRGSVCRSLALSIVEVLSGQHEEISHGSRSAD